MTAKLVALHTWPEDQPAFDKEFFEVHMPLVKKMPGLVKTEVARLPEKDVMGNPCPYYLMVEMFFPDPDTLNQALRSPEGRAAGADVMRFTPKGFTLLPAEICLDEAYEKQSV